MIVKTLLVSISDYESFPYEEGLLGGTLNKNHLMYKACAAFQKRKGELDPSRAHYRFFLNERDTETNTHTRTEL